MVVSFAVDLYCLDDTQCCLLRIESRRNSNIELYVARCVFAGQRNPGRGRAYVSSMSFTRYAGPKPTPGLATSGSIRATEL